MNTEIYQIKEEWDLARRGRKRCSSQGHESSDHVRNTLILLLIVTVAVFAFDRRTEIQRVASAKIHLVINHSSGSINLRQHAINYENQLDQITK
jgi:hypothetical protein